jgi:hypothetical protein
MSDVMQKLKLTSMAGARRLREIGMVSNAPQTVKLDEDTIERMSEVEFKLTAPFYSN